MTEIERSREVEGNTKLQPLQLKNWCFTWNNYTVNDIERLVICFESLCDKYVFQEETGENGTPHLQGTITLKKAMRWTAFNLPKIIHWEKTKDVAASYAYCQKDDTRTGKIYSKGLPKKLRIIEKLRGWQQTIKCIIDEDEPDERTIHWIYDELGCNGKTVFTKYLHATVKTIICTGGEHKDIACIIALNHNAGFDLNDKFTFIMDIPRCVEHISYKAIESVKSGLVMSSKYESVTLSFNSPHVFIFSNQLPDFDKISKDRWKVFTIEDDELVEFQIYK